MAFYYLLLGHLMGDFVLQTDRIAENKGAHWQWNLLHVLVVTFCTALLSYHFGILLVILVILNGALHYILDYFKGGISRSLHLPELAAFLLDQSVHITILFLISLTAIYNPNVHYMDFLYIKYILILVLITSFSAVFNQFVLAAMFPRTKSKFFEEGEKILGILTRLFFSVILYLAFFLSHFYFILIPVLAAIIFLMWRTFKWLKWMSPLQLLAKLLLDSIFSALGILALYLI